MTASLDRRDVVLPLEVSVERCRTGWQCMNNEMPRDVIGGRLVPAGEFTSKVRPRVNETRALGNHHDLSHATLPLRAISTALSVVCRKRVGSTSRAEQFIARFGKRAFHPGNEGAGR